MVVVHLSSAYGSTSGTSSGPIGPAGQSTRIKQFSVWADSSYIRAMKLYWTGSNATVGDTSLGTQYDVALASNEWVCGIFVDVDAQGILRGLSFDSNLSTGIMTVGYIGDGFTTVIDNSTYKWTDIVAYIGTLSSLTTIWGLKFYYTTPTLPQLAPSDIALPALGILAHTAVVAKSMGRVGDLRGQLSIQAPSCDPPHGTDPEKAQLWYRTFRAQENCKESFLVIAPSILIASTFGFEVFGKWATRTVGVLSLVSAFYRYKFLNAYIEDASKRGPPFHHAMIAAKPIFYLAVVSCGYIVGKNLYERVSHRLRRHE